MVTNNAINLGKSTFNAFASAASNNVTGDGSIYDIIFDTATVNEGSCYDTSTGIFTIPEAGNYLFNTTVDINNITSANTTAYLYIYVLPVMKVLSYGGAADLTNRITMSGSIMLSLGKGEQVYVIIRVDGTSKTIGLAAGSCKFSGTQLL